MSLILETVLTAAARSEKELNIQQSVFVFAFLTGAGESSRIKPMGYRTCMQIILHSVCSLLRFVEKERY